MSVNAIAMKSIFWRPFQAALLGAIVKGIGSGWRVADDWYAPMKVRDGTIKRESAIVAQVSVYSYLLDMAWLGLQKAFPAMAVEAKDSLAKGLLRSLPAAGGIFIAEAMSRKWAPRNLWNPDGTLKQEYKTGAQGNPAAQSPVESPKAEPARSVEKKSEHHSIKRQPLTFAQATPGPSSPVMPLPLPNRPSRPSFRATTFASRTPARPFLSTPFSLS